MGLIAACSIENGSVVHLLIVCGYEGHQVQQTKFMTYAQDELGGHKGQNDRFGEKHIEPLPMSL